MKTLTIEEYKKRITTLEAQREKFEASMSEFDRVKGDITLGIGTGNHWKGIFPQKICPDLARCLVSGLRVE